MKKLSINTATAEEISEKVAMIGQQKAQAIVDFREAQGPFKSIKDIKNVPGFSEKLVDSLEIYFDTEEETAKKSKK